MIFLANRANLDTRTLLTRLHNRLQTQVSKETAPVEQVWYYPSAGNKTEVRATVSPDTFLRTTYGVDEAELQVSFDFPQTHSYDFYTVQWVESERELMLGWHQDETHMELGPCHVQIDYQGDTVQREQAEFLDAHPLNVFDQRIEDLVTVLDALTWNEDTPRLPKEAIR